MSGKFDNWQDFVKASITSGWIDGQARHSKGGGLVGGSPSQNWWIGDYKQVNEEWKCGFLWLDTCTMSYGYYQEGIQKFEDNFGGFTSGQWLGYTPEQRRRATLEYLEKESNLSVNLNRVDAVINMNLIEFGTPIYSEYPDAGMGSEKIAENLFSRADNVDASVEYSKSWSWENTITDTRAVGVDRTIGTEFSVEIGNTFAKAGISMSASLSNSIEWSHSQSNTATDSESITSTINRSVFLEPGERVGVRSIVTQSDVMVPYRVPVDLSGEVRIEGKEGFAKGNFSKGWISPIGGAMTGPIYNASPSALAAQNVQNIQSPTELLGTSGDVQMVDLDKARSYVHGVLKVDDHVRVVSTLFEVDEGHAADTVWQSEPQNQPASASSKRSLKNGGIHADLREFNKIANADGSFAVVDGKSVDIGDLHEVDQSNKTYIGSDQHDVFECTASSGGNTYIGGMGINEYHLGDHEDLVYAVNNGGTDVITGGDGSTHVYAKNTNPHFELGKGRDYVKFTSSNDSNGLIDLGSDKSKDILEVKFSEVNDLDMGAGGRLLVENFDLNKDYLKLKGIKDFQLVEMGQFLEIFDGSTHLVTLSTVGDYDNDEFKVRGDVVIWGEVV